MISVFDFAMRLKRVGYPMAQIEILKISSQSEERLDNPPCFLTRSESKSTSLWGHKRYCIWCIDCICWRNLICEAALVDQHIDCQDIWNLWCPHSACAFNNQSFSINFECLGIFLRILLLGHIFLLLHYAVISVIFRSF